jgi:putative phosphoribosyl transferase
MERIFEDRRHAGKRLAEHIKLNEKEKSNTIVLGLPRGGIPIAYEVSQALNCPLDVLIVRKIGHPRNSEYGIGAITEDGSYWLDPEASVSHITSLVIDSIIAKEKKELERRIAKYRDHDLPNLRGKNIVLVDDGLATGVTAKVGARYLKSLGVEKIILAVPVCASDSVKKLRTEVDQVICINEPEYFLGVGEYYKKFDQTSDEEVLDLLSRSRGAQSIEVEIPYDGGVKTKGTLTLPINAKALVIFAHESSNGRFNPKNMEVASLLNKAGIGTLLLVLLTEEEALDRHNIFDIPFLGIRLVSATKWIKFQEVAKNLSIGYFGANTGGGAVLWAAGELENPVAAVVSLGGRPDLAISRLAQVSAPTLLIVGERDRDVIKLNKIAYRELRNAKISLIPHATHLFEEPRAMEQVSMEAVEWFLKYCAGELTDLDKEKDFSTNLNNVLPFKNYTNLSY